jgi:chemotaxis protein MotA
MSSTGLAYIGALIYLAVACFWTSPDNPFEFADAHGAFMVFAGFTIVALLAVPWEYLKKFFPMIRTVSRKVHDDSAEVLQLIVQAAEKARVELSSVADILPKVNDPFLKDALGILLEGYDARELETILRRRIEVQKERENSDAKMFKNLGKYPPATGLIGTVMGMIALLGSLGQEGAESKVGPAMSVAMAATLYGVILANIVILPVADNLMFRTQKVVAKREMIVEGIMLIKKQAPVAMVREMLLAHLSPKQRMGLKTLAKPELKAATTARTMRAATPCTRPRTPSTARTTRKASLGS